MPGSASANSPTRWHQVLAMAETGRPKVVTPEIAAKICERIAEGETVREIGASQDMPSARTIYLTLASDEAFSQQYARSREAQLIRWEDELIEIADDATNDWMERQNADGSKQDVLNSENIQRARVRIDTRKWIMAKRLPKKYGDRVTQEISGPNGGPIETKDLTDSARAKALYSFLAKVKAGGATDGR